MITPVVIGAQSPFQHSDTELYTDDILGPVWFSLYNLRVAGTNADPAAPVQSKYIVAEDEVFEVSVDIKFNKTPLSSLLMCLGTRLSVNFAFEGFGKNATEVDLQQSIVTKRGEYEYTIVYKTTPAKAGLTPGLYEIAAVAEIGPVENECKTPVFGHGYIEEILLSVYPAGADLP
ncbi:MAG: hypothetical protein HC769_13325 [Cyanobacteria bacterium CRU_2_1]|nr:hypothetical protein [Cyanobacteria bacterium RU_5_0]NJR59730.1 hypothetical protein [Cyanobacteria bacterium CRU_2_1]